MADPELDVLLPSWELALRAERKSPQTVKAYGDGVRRFLAWCADGRAAVLDRPPPRVRQRPARGWRQASTARSRQLGVRRFSAWLVEEGEIDADPLLGVKAPKLDAKVVEPLTDDELRALLRACPPGASPGPAHRRDEALVRFMVETGARAGEVVALERAPTSTWPPGAPSCAAARAARAGGPVRAADLAGPGPLPAPATRPPPGRRPRPCGWGTGARRSPTTRCTRRWGCAPTAAGIAGFHPHQLRHTAAHRWLAAGGSEGGLMAVAGWTRPDMLMRYTKAQASARAADEARKLNLGDV